MGMYDTVHAKCPKCDGLVRIQSKAGECFLGTYTERDMPSSIAEDIDGSWTVCDDCNSSFKIKVITVVCPTYEVWLK